MVGELRPELFRPPTGECREILGRPLKRRERDPARLVRQRHLHVGAAGERLEQRPLGSGQILEPVGEDRLAVPGAEVALQALGCLPAHDVAVPEAEPVELVPVGAVEGGETAVEILGVDEAGLELAERRDERVREAVEARRQGQPVEPRACFLDRAPGRKRLLRRRGEGLRRSGVAVPAGDQLEEVVEGPDRPSEQAAAALQEVAFHPVDVRPVRHDQKRLFVEPGEVALEEKGDFARVCGACDEAQAHRAILDLPEDDSRTRNSAKTPLGAAFARARREGPAAPEVAHGRRRLPGVWVRRPRTSACARAAQRPCRASSPHTDHRGRRPSNRGVRP